MHSVAVMAQAIDTIEAHLRDDLTVADMADAVSYSLYHFCRTFNQVTHHTPYDYLIRRRLAEAARELLLGERKIIEIAFDYQFNSPETFSRAFKRVFEMQPNQWRKQGHLDRHLIMPRLTLAHLERIHQGAYLKPVIADRDALHLTGVMTLVKPGARTVTELWDWFAREAPPGDLYSVAYYGDNWEERGFLYMAGVALEPTAAPHDAWAIKSLPAQRYARFVHVGPEADLPVTLDYVYHTWRPNSGCRLAARQVLVHYGPQRREALESESAVYIPVA